MGVNFVLMTEAPSGHEMGPRTHSGFLGGGGAGSRNYCMTPKAASSPRAEGHSHRR